MGIVVTNTNLAVRGIDFHDVVYGVCTDGDGYVEEVDTCTFVNAYYGVRFNGDVANSSLIHRCLIVTDDDLDYQPFGGTATFEYPIGIRLTYPISNSSITSCLISEDTIAVLADRGIGIELMDISPNVLVELNRIHLLPPHNTKPGGTGNVMSSGQQSDLHAGIYVLRANEDSHISGNTIWGNSNSYYTTSTFPPITTLNEPSGMIMEYCYPSNFLECNNLHDTRYGFQVIGNCNPSSLSAENIRVNGNEFFDNAVGMMFKYSGGTQGFGRKIGDTYWDSRNEFYGSLWETISGNAVKIYFFQDPGTTQTVQRRIYTTSSTIAATDSHPIGTFDRYAKTSNSMATTVFACTGAYDFLVGNHEGEILESLEDSPSPEDLQSIEDLARGENEPLYSGDVAGWLQAKDVYRFLHKNPSFVNNSSVLDSFYTSLLSSPFEQIRLTEEGYRLLSDSAICADSVTFAQVLSSTVEANESMSPTNVFEENEQLINRLMLKKLLYGQDSISSNDLELIETLAYSCLNTAGTAVFKARFLYQTFVAIKDFDDVTMCPPSQERNAGNLKSENNFSIYPNPASNIIMINYIVAENKSTTLLIYDIYGRLVHINTLWPMTFKHDIDVSNLQNGIYYYQLKENGCTIGSGKFIIAK